METQAGRRGGGHSCVHCPQVWCSEQTAQNHSQLKQGPTRHERNQGRNREEAFQPAGSLLLTLDLLPHGLLPAKGLVQSQGQDRPWLEAMGSLLKRNGA